MKMLEQQDLQEQLQQMKISNSINQQLQQINGQNNHIATASLQQNVQPLSLLLFILLQAKVNLS